MKPSSPVENRPTINRAKARNCALMNLLATPGLGSLMGGRILPGIGQLALAIAGFALVVYWFVKVLGTAFSTQNGEPPSYSILGLAGAAAFAAAWLWSLVTSLSLMREGRNDEANESTGTPPHLN